MKCLIEMFGSCLWVVARENSGEHWFSRPSEHVSPKRACLAQARSTEARPSYFTRAVAQATHTIFERANASLRREGSRLSEITRKVTVPLFEPSPSSISPNWEEWDGMKSTWNMNEDGLQRMA
ncbi:hypothetical protein DEO72_LG5g969 [Vigna unguiculata]|uniref:Uncharacterized protein n=1 Tax=Vigna unguiculata TaxID=3917 RepID=A0A4D6LWP8_VIGUN|nr:hypothetical protein DEO72_LG5g969 [Vigna unguiculata]